MRRTLTSLIVLCCLSGGIAQLLTNEVKAIPISNEEGSTDDIELKNNLIKVSASLSEGFTDSLFQNILQLSISDDQLLSMETDYQRTLQYTISNVEGIIFKKGKLFTSGTVDLSSYRDGSYAIYFFAGKKIVRALLLERKRASM